MFVFQNLNIALAKSHFQSLVEYHCATFFAPYMYNTYKHQPIYYSNVKTLWGKLEANAIIPMKLNT